MGGICNIYFTKGTIMSINIAIGNDPIDIKRLNTIKQILESQNEEPDIVDVKSWISDIYDFLTDPSVFTDICDL